MVSKERRWAASSPALLPQTKTEELKMDRKPPIQGMRTVRRTFEPHRLSKSWLAQAYERIVPQRVRPIGADPHRVERGVHASGRRAR